MTITEEAALAALDHFCPLFFENLQQLSIQAFLCDDKDCCGSLYIATSCPPTSSKKTRPRPHIRRMKIPGQGRRAATRASARAVRACRRRAAVLIKYTTDAHLHPIRGTSSPVIQTQDLRERVQL